MSDRCPLGYFFNFVLCKFCKSDISESIIGRDLKLLSACRVDYLVIFLKKNELLPFEYFDFDTNFVIAI